MVLQRKEKVILEVIPIGVGSSQDVTDTWGCRTKQLVYSPFFIKITARPRKILAVGVKYLYA